MGYRIVAIAADCKSALIEFGGSSPSTPTIGDVAQLVEHCTEDAGVSSSNLFITTIESVAQLVRALHF